MSSGLALRVAGVMKQYETLEGPLVVLQDLTFSAEAGERIAVVGRSGAGKSTLLHILGTLDRPTQGIVTYGNVNVFDRKASALARFRNSSLGFVFQFHHLLEEFTALENVMMPAIVQRISRERARNMALSVLQRVGLGARIEHKPGELSGGERQRVAVARAIVMKPSVLLADEPTGNLDKRTAEGIHDLLVELNEEEGMSLIVVTHNLELARRMHRQIRLIEGRALEEKPGSAIHTEERTAS